MADINKELLSVFESFQAFMQNPKYVETPIIVKDKRNNHPSSLEYVHDVESSHPFGHTYIDVEVKDGDSRKFSAKLMSDKIEAKVLMRYDSAGSPHRNNYDDIPLADQQVSTPHLHYYDNAGRFLAKKTPEISADETKAREIKQGFSILCKESNIYGKLTTIPPIIQVGRQTEIPFEQPEIDPCENVNFK